MKKKLKIILGVLSIATATSTIGTVIVLLQKTRYEIFKEKLRGLEQLNKFLKEQDDTDFYDENQLQSQVDKFKAIEDIIKNDNEKIEESIKEIDAIFDSYINQTKELLNKFKEQMESIKDSEGISKSDKAEIDNLIKEIDRQLKYKELYESLATVEQSDKLAKAIETNLDAELRQLDAKANKLINDNQNNPLFTNDVAELKNVKDNVKANANTILNKAQGVIDLRAAIEKFENKLKAENESIKNKIDELLSEIATLEPNPFFKSEVLKNTVKVEKDKIKQIPENDFKKMNEEIPVLIDLINKIKEDIKANQDQALEEALEKLRQNINNANGKKEAFVSNEAKNILENGIQDALRVHEDPQANIDQVNNAIDTLKEVLKRAEAENQKYIKDGKIADHLELVKLANQLANDDAYLTNKTISEAQKQVITDTINALKEVIADNTLDVINNADNISIEELDNANKNLKDNYLNAKDTIKAIIVNEFIKYANDIIRQTETFVDSTSKIHNQPNEMVVVLTSEKNDFKTKIDQLNLSENKFETDLTEYNNALKHLTDNLNNTKETYNEFDSILKLIKQDKEALLTKINQLNELGADTTKYQTIFDKHNDDLTTTTTLETLKGYDEELKKAIKEADAEIQKTPSKQSTIAEINKLIEKGDKIYSHLEDSEIKREFNGLKDEADNKDNLNETELTKLKDKLTNSVAKGEEALRKKLLDAIRLNLEEANSLLAKLTTPFLKVPKAFLENVINSITNYENDGFENLLVKKNALDFAIRNSKFEIENDKESNSYLEYVDKLNALLANEDVKTNTKLASTIANIKTNMQSLASKYNDLKDQTGGDNLADKKDKMIRLRQDIVNKHDTYLAEIKQSYLNDINELITKVTETEPHLVHETTKKTQLLDVIKPQSTNITESSDLQSIIDYQKNLKTALNEAIQAEKNVYKQWSLDNKDQTALINQLKELGLTSEADNLASKLTEYSTILESADSQLAQLAPTKKLMEDLIANAKAKPSSHTEFKKLQTQLAKLLTEADGIKKLITTPNGNDIKTELQSAVDSANIKTNNNNPSLNDGYENVIAKYNEVIPQLTKAINAAKTKWKAKEETRYNDIHAKAVELGNYNEYLSNKNIDDDQKQKITNALETLKQIIKTNTIDNLTEAEVNHITEAANNLTDGYNKAKNQISLIITNDFVSFSTEWTTKVDEFIASNQHISDITDNTISELSNLNKEMKNQINALNSSPNKDHTNLAPYNQKLQTLIKKYESAKKEYQAFSDALSAIKSNKTILNNKVEKLNNEGYDTQEYQTLLNKYTEEQLKALTIEQLNTYNQELQDAITKAEQQINVIPSKSQTIDEINKLVEKGNGLFDKLGDSSQKTEFAALAEKAKNASTLNSTELQKLKDKLIELVSWAEEALKNKLIEDINAKLETAKALLPKMASNFLSKPKEFLETQIAEVGTDHTNDSLEKLQAKVDKIDKAIKNSNQEIENNSNAEKIEAIIAKMKKLAETPDIKASENQTIKATLVQLIADISDVERDYATLKQQTGSENLDTKKAALAKLVQTSGTKYFNDLNGFKNEFYNELQAVITKANDTMPLLTNETEAKSALTTNKQAAEALQNNSDLNSIIENKNTLASSLNNAIEAERNVYKEWSIANKDQTTLINELRKLGLTSEADNLASKLTEYSTILESADSQLAQLAPTKKLMEDLIANAKTKASNHTTFKKLQDKLSSLLTEANDLAGLINNEIASNVINKLKQAIQTANTDTNNNNPDLSNGYDEVKVKYDEVISNLTNAITKAKNDWKELEKARYDQLKSNANALIGDKSYLNDNALSKEAKQTITSALEALNDVVSNNNITNPEATGNDLKTASDNIKNKYDETKQIIKDNQANALIAKANDLTGKIDQFLAADNHISNFTNTKNAQLSTNNQQLKNKIAELSAIKDKKDLDLSSYTETINALTTEFEEAKTLYENYKNALDTVKQSKQTLSSKEQQLRNEGYNTQEYQTLLKKYDENGLKALSVEQLNAYNQELQDAITKADQQINAIPTKSQTIDEINKLVEKGNGLFDKLDNSTEKNEYKKLVEKAKNASTLNAAELKDLKDKLTNSVAWAEEALKNKLIEDINSKLNTANSLLPQMNSNYLSKPKEALERLITQVGTNHTNDSLDQLLAKVDKLDKAIQSSNLEIENNTNAAKLEAIIAKMKQLATKSDITNSQNPAIQSTLSQLKAEISDAEREYGNLKQQTGLENAKTKQTRLAELVTSTGAKYQNDLTSFKNAFHNELQSVIAKANETLPLLTNETPAKATLTTNKQNAQAIQSNADLNTIIENKNTLTSSLNSAIDAERNVIKQWSRDNKNQTALIEKLKTLGLTTDANNLTSKLTEYSSVLESDQTQLSKLASTKTLMADLINDLKTKATKHEDFLAEQRKLTALLTDAKSFMDSLPQPEADQIKNTLLTAYNQANTQTNNNNPDLSHGYESIMQKYAQVISQLTSALTKAKNDYKALALQKYNNLHTETADFINNKVNNDPTLQSNFRDQFNTNYGGSVDNLSADAILAKYNQLVQFNNSIIGQAWNKTVQDTNRTIEEVRTYPHNEKYLTSLNTQYTEATESVGQTNTNANKIAQRDKLITAMTLKQQMLDNALAQWRTLWDASNEYNKNPWLTNRAYPNTNFNTYFKTIPRNKFNDSPRNLEEYKKVWSAIEELQGKLFDANNQMIGLFKTHPIKRHFTWKSEDLSMKYTELFVSYIKEYTMLIKNGNFDLLNDRLEKAQGLEQFSRTISKYWNLRKQFNFISSNYTEEPYNTIMGSYVKAMQPILIKGVDADSSVDELYTKLLKDMEIGKMISDKFDEGNGFAEFLAKNNNFRNRTQYLDNITQKFEDKYEKNASLITSQGVLMHKAITEYLETEWNKLSNLVLTILPTTASNIANQITQGLNATETQKNVAINPNTPNNTLTTLETDEQLLRNLVSTRALVDDALKQLNSVATRNYTTTLLGSTKIQLATIKNKLSSLLPNPTYNSDIAGSLRSGLNNFINYFNQQHELLTRLFEQTKSAPNENINLRIQVLQKTIEYATIYLERFISYTTVGDVGYEIDELVSRFFRTYYSTNVSKGQYGWLNKEAVSMFIPKLDSPDAPNNYLTRDNAFNYIYDMKDSRGNAQSRAINHILILDGFLPYVYQSYKSLDDLLTKLNNWNTIKNDFIRSAKSTGTTQVENVKKVLNSVEKEIFDFYQYFVTENPIPWKPTVADDMTPQYNKILNVVQEKAEKTNDGTSFGKYIRSRIYEITSMVAANKANASSLWTAITMLHNTNHTFETMRNSSNDFELTIFNEGYFPGFYKTANKTADLLTTLKMLNDKFANTSKTFAVLPQLTIPRTETAGQLFHYGERKYDEKFGSWKENESELDNKNPNFAVFKQNEYTIHTQYKIWAKYIYRFKIFELDENKLNRLKEIERNALIKYNANAPEEAIAILKAGLKELYNFQ
ncbi:hypothetical protein [[Mycoplasma] anseris]|uniref:Uncharacterized protein n=1 Tax=[Mycoplasma] anseris TaxID=92400 RepID=A0A2Z4NDG7_9BACT|nr:hypothetical protein [[Mycoplasma] anseris]AWX69548.1 hypothetical protein DP065_02170 [[Mycoplasma] anseris]